ncbi:Tetratricopeptide repeat-containing protein [Alkalispirochaeta americana]|uniref:Tetratricopeptide repeat-containing protein n=1 Tax=Alkalispirochaeta americana TaxID=159291 RepID=A0A1N6NAD2_9SPIO|nr:tetratricopeptide repeat protein [Alkalispirochaeta americana]SIP89039.1 Tetratricopeptide repeat-containing protein [Alkalispirochaeta americana]
MTDRPLQRQAGSVSATIPLVLAFSLLMIIGALPEPAHGNSRPHQVRSEHYLVISRTSQAEAEDVADTMEALLSLYNRKFRFPLETLETPFRVELFGSPREFDQFLPESLERGDHHFVYLHYDDPAKNTLAGLDFSRNAAHGREGNDHPGRMQLPPALVHQSFVQFFRAFVPNPPLWIREGFALHFEAVQYDPEYRTISFRENLNWLDPLQDILSGRSEATPMALEEILAVTPREVLESSSVFYPQAWGMISFLLNAEDPEINRVLWDSISALSEEASLEENVRRVYRSAFRWIEQERLEEAFLSYISSRNTFRGWVEKGVSAFHRQELEEAEESFTQAAFIEEDHYVPPYFLGLIHYQRGDHDRADQFYQRALDRGADRATTLYALAVTAFASDRLTEAEEYLKEAILLEPEYQDRAEELLSRLRRRRGRS